jgi:ribosome maturation factor RimP
MSRQVTAARVQEIAERVGEKSGLEIVEVELKGSGRNQLLRVFIDKPGGVTHGDCETLSRQMEELLDAEDLFPDQYTLEVSSPGVERKLKKPNDFERFQGQKARLVLKEEGKNRSLVGTLAGTGDSGILLVLPDGERVHIPFSSIDRANLKFEW